jgi:hypothetical protein
MAKFRIKKASLDKITANLEALKLKKQKQLALALANWAQDVVEAIGKGLEDVNAIDQGILHAATAAGPVELIGTKLHIVIYNPLEYAVIVEWGRQPGSHPPLLPLIGWSVRKGIVQNLPVNLSPEAYAKQLAASAAILRNMHKGGGGGKGSSKPMDPVVHDLLIVRLIAKKISEKGVAGRHPFSIAWEQKIRTFQTDIAKMVQ